MNKRCCCICEGASIFEDLLIHHIDGDNSNNRIENLAVLCLKHASMADAGLMKGKLGAGRKLSPPEVRGHKRRWEAKAAAQRKVPGGKFPLHERKHLRLLYVFDIGRVKNEIMSTGDNDRRLRERLDYLGELVLEEWLSGLDLRGPLLEAYSTMAVSAIDRTNLPKLLSREILQLFTHLLGPDKVKMGARDVKLVTRAFEVLQTLADFSAEFNPHRAVLKTACDAIYKLAEIACWYKLRSARPRILAGMSGIRRSCGLYGPQKGAGRAALERSKRLRIVEDTVARIKAHTFDAACGP